LKRSSTSSTAGSSDQVNQGLDHPWELGLGEAVIFVGVELIEDLFEQRGMSSSQKRRIFFCIFVMIIAYKCLAIKEQHLNTK
jgi:hypothetical protein